MKLTGLVSSTSGMSYSAQPSSMPGRAATACPRRSAPAPPGRPRRPTCAGPSRRRSRRPAGSSAAWPSVSRRPGAADRAAPRSSPAVPSGSASTARYSTGVSGRQVQRRQVVERRCTPATRSRCRSRVHGAAGDPALDRARRGWPARGRPPRAPRPCRGRRCPRRAPRSSPAARGTVADRERAGRGVAARCRARRPGTAPACRPAAPLTSWNTWYGALSSVPIERHGPLPTLA